MMNTALNGDFTGRVAASIRATNVLLVSIVRSSKSGEIGSSRSFGACGY
jgi:hypothetical protein